MWCSTNKAEDDCVIYNKYLNVDKRVCPVSQM